MSNSENPRKGADFQKLVRDWFVKSYNQDFALEKKIAIGVPSKDHKFDIVCDSLKMAIECKRYTWTESGNVPSAKMGFTNEAAFYLSFLPVKYIKYIVMYYSYNAKRAETLAEYYYRTYKHLIGNIHVLEYNPDEDIMRDLSTDYNSKLIAELKELLRNRKLSSEYYKVFSENNLLYADYYDYMTTSPINIQKELERIPSTDFSLCIALMTMLFRADHFDNGSFERYIKEGSVGVIVKRMIELLSI